MTARIEAGDVARNALLAPLSVRDFRWALGGRFFSLVADFAQSVTLAVLVLDLTQRPSGWGTLLMVQGIPRALLMLVGGLATDRFRSRSILVAANLLQALALAVLIAPIALGVVELWHLYAYAVVSGVTFAFFMPASQAIIPELLPREQVRSGNALWQLAFNIARFVGPPIAGTLVALAGHAVALAATVAAFLLGAVVYWPIRGAPAGPRPVGSQLQQLRDGLRAARQDAAVWVIIVWASVFNFGFAATTFVGLPSLAKLALDAGDEGVGILYAAFGGGSLLGALATGAVASLRRQGIVGCITTIGTGLPLMATALAPSIWAAVPLLAVSGAFNSAAGVIYITLVQTRTPPEVRGRVLSLLTLSLFGLTPLAFGLGGLLGDVFGPRGILVVGGAAVTLCGALMLAYRAIREVD